jgi:hypothetical protein
LEARSAFNAYLTLEFGYSEATSRSKREKMCDVEGVASENVQRCIYSGLLAADGWEKVYPTLRNSY